MNRIRYSSRALRDADELVRYIERQDPKVARAVSNAIELALQRLAQDHRLAVQTDTKGIRRYPVRKYGATLFVRHRPRLGVLEVVRVVRGRRVKALGRVPKS